MKISNTISRFTFALRAIAVSAISLSTPLSAQQNAGGQAPTPVLPQQKDASNPAPQLETARRGSSARAVIPEVNISAGQNLDYVVDLLSETTGANFVVDESLKQMKIQALKLRNVTVTAVLEAIRATSKQRIVVSYNEERPPAALMVTIVPNSREPQDSTPKKICRVFSLPDAGWMWGRFRAVAPPTDDASEEEKVKWAQQEEKAQKALRERVALVNEAVQQACKGLAVANGEKKTAADFPKFEVHAASRLIMVIGHEADVEIAAQIISGVGGVAMPGTKAETRNSDQEKRPAQGSRPTVNPVLN